MSPFAGYIFKTKMNTWRWILIHFSTNIMSFDSKSWCRTPRKCCVWRTASWSQIDEGWQHQNIPLSYKPVTTWSLTLGRIIAVPDYIPWSSFLQSGARIIYVFLMEKKMNHFLMRLSFWSDKKIPSTHHHMTIIFRHSSCCIGKP